MDRAASARPLSLVLREATRDVHQRLGRLLRLTEPGLTLDGYVDIVEAYFGFYAPLEARLESVAANSRGAVPMRGREKVKRLRDDLLACGSTERRIDALPRCDWVPQVTTASRALGCLYVVEGACLGGRVIAHALGEHLGLSRSTGASFFEGYGAATGAMWRSLIEHLDACTTSPGETVAAAVETFLGFERWLAAQGVLP